MIIVCAILIVTAADTIIFLLVVATANAKDCGDPFTDRRPIATVAATTARSSRVLFVRGIVIGAAAPFPPAAAVRKEVVAIKSRVTKRCARAADYGFECVSVQHDAAGAGGGERCE